MRSASFASMSRPVTMRSSARPGPTIWGSRKLIPASVPLSPVRMNAEQNRAVEARYVNYVAETKNGMTLTGVLTSETATNITLTGADGKQHVILRTDLEDLVSTGKSMMPEGLEQELKPQDFADLIAHLRGGVMVAWC